MNACRKCGVPSEHEVKLNVYGREVGVFCICDGCFARAADGARLWGEEFARLLRAGKTNAEANDELCRRMGAGELPPKLLN